MTATRSTDGPTVRVGLWGVFGTGNFGNEATLSALLQRFAPAPLVPVVLCERPDEARARHGVEAVALGPVVERSRAGRWGRLVGTARDRAGLLVGAVRTVRDLDAVVLAGTGCFERLGSGAWGVPYEIWALSLATRLRRRPFVVLDVGAETSPRATARAFVRSAARSARYRSFRDESSRSSMVAIGAAAPDDVVATDLAFGLDLRSAPPPAAERSLVLGVMAYRGRDDSQGADPEAAYRARVLRLVRLLDEAGWHVTLVGGDDVDLGFARSLEGLPPHVAVVEARTPEELVALTGRAVVTVATRYHSVIMSLLAGTPVVSIGYGEKHRAVLLQLGLEDTHRDVETFDPVEVVAMVEDQARRHDEIRARIASGVADARERLDAQWPAVEDVLLARRTRRTVAA
ncbi:polysaccharide pyruvyl transferase family protein [Cellulosimicrobium sp. I38E]|uniref:polysaccharide pyruvyl transferase family protein n=1 Tax=Cellulosimicrobium sp. I38E TaxID=1393139 RepID=UPI0007B1E7AF|nr:polysaccharide pyruvyl transferase family protein [Cellulosimicrobium sp. I38E]KZM79378.1 hypothetical protein A0J59_09575 [Cellulosimicrobium sp. I38E]